MSYTGLYCTQYHTVHYTVCSISSITKTASSLDWLKYSSHLETNPSLLQPISVALVTNRFLRVISPPQTKGKTVCELDKMPARTFHARREDWTTFNSFIKNADESDFAELKLQALDEEGTVTFRASGQENHVYHRTLSGRWSMLRSGVGPKDVDGNEILTAEKDSVWRRRFLIEEPRPGAGEPRRYKLETKRKGSKHYTLVEGHEETDDDEKNAVMRIASDGVAHFGYELECEKEDLSDELVAFCWFLVNMMNRRANRDGRFGSILHADRHPMLIPTREAT